MKQGTYEVEAQVERDHWWFRGRRRILTRLIADLNLPAGARVLDVGCGTGANGPVLAADGRFAVGIDASPIPLALTGSGGGERGHTARARSDATLLPFGDQSFDLVVALDVLEHLADDVGAAREMHRVLRPGGALLVFVPALMILWGLQDDVSHHLRRYHGRQLRAVLTGANFEIQRSTYFNTLLFPAILAARLAMRVRRPSHMTTENEVGGPLTNRVLDAIFALEAPMLARFNLPVGVSLACVARALS
ncbi:MAG TPA: methyltransferase domain-containing protein [Polyangia bacterium]|nr:methyltransferase domain-containing protein [Polyangia bacterium]